MYDPNLDRPDFERPPNRMLIRREEKNEEESKTMLAILSLIHISEPTRPY